MLMGHTRLPCVQGTAGGTCVWKHIQCGKGLRCREGESVSLSAKPAVVRPAEVPSPQGWARKVFKEWNGTHRSGAYARGAVCAPWAVLRSVAVPTPPGWIRQGCRLSSLLSTLPTQLHLHDQLLPL